MPGVGETCEGKRLHSGEERRRHQAQYWKVEERRAIQQSLGYLFPHGLKLAVCSKSSVRNCTEGLTRSP